MSVYTQKESERFSVPQEDYALLFSLSPFENAFLRTLGTPILRLGEGKLLTRAYFPLFFLLFIPRT